MKQTKMYEWYHRAKAERDWNNYRYDPSNMYEILGIRPIKRVTIV